MAQKAYTKTDLSVRWEPEADAGFWGEFYVQNIEDRQNVKTNLESATTHRTFWLAAPRTFGVRVGYTWAGDSLPF
jgi:hypothetical protein